MSAPERFIFLVERQDEKYHDEAHAVIVRAKDWDEAISVAKNASGDQDPECWDTAKVTKINPTRGFSKILLTDFHAG